MKNASTRTLLVGTALPILAALGLGACKDDLTETATPQGALSAPTLASSAGVEGSLVATYRALDWNQAVGGGWGNAASDWVWASVTSDDAYKGSVSDDQPGATDVELYQWTTGNADSYLNDKWKGVYEGVSRANATLTLLQKVQAQSPGAIDAAAARSIAGEAIFLRAHYHFSGWRLWGNIPYYREADSTDFRKPNEQSPQVVADILKDLDSAIVLLPDAPRDGNKGRVTKWTATAYKGRVQAYAGQWAQALTTLRAVQASNKYGLEDSYDRVWTAFPEYANGRETILAFQASANDGDIQGDNANWGERLNFPHSGSHFGCCGFHQPSQNLVNFFRVDPATGLPLAIVSPGTWNANNNNFKAGALQPVDPRLDWTVGRDTVPYKDWGYPDASWNRDRSYGGPYQPKKNVHEQTANAESTVGWTPQQLNSVKMHIFRYADMLLLLAEAEVEAGSLENARQIVNSIRARAAVKVQGPGGTYSVVGGKSVFTPDRSSIAVSISDARITWARYQIGQYPSFPSQDYARTAVRYERRLELAMEGQRFFDLKRWGIMPQTLTDYLTAEKVRRPYLTAATTPTTRNNLYPIPSLQLELSKVNGVSTLTQNTGW